jgi:hypothetical protein
MTLKVFLLPFLTLQKGRRLTGRAPSVFISKLLLTMDSDRHILPGPLLLIVIGIMSPDLQIFCLAR